MNDARLAALAARPTSVDAAGWVDRAPSRSVTLGEWSPARSVAFLTRLRDSRPRRVVAIDAEDDPELGTGASTLVIELPEDSAGRAGIFALEAEVASNGGFDAERDVGQHYLMLHW